MDKFSALKYYYGYDTFKEGQAEVIDQLLAGRDALCIMPTGAGKSVCYQIPALLQSGTTIVVSPLISLMNDRHFFQPGNKGIIDIFFYIHHCIIKTFSTDIDRHRDRLCFFSVQCTIARLFRLALFHRHMIDEHDIS